MPDIQPKKFMHIESDKIPLEEVSASEVKHHVIDPITNKPYDGIYLKGCFADLSNRVANNNERFYDIPRYLELLQLLRKQVHGDRGVYGEFEHPKSYMPNPKKASHKIVDVWYDEKEQKVFGIIVLLNRGDGLLAQEIIRTGGKLAISARAAGEEIKKPDGTKLAITKLLTTYDIVWYPGFPNAILDHMPLQKLNESKVDGFSVIVYEDDFDKIPNKFNEYIILNESEQHSECFIEWYGKNLNENSQQNSQTQKEEQILEKNQTNDESKVEKKLQKATDNDLSQNNKEQDSLKQKYLNQMIGAQKKLKSDKAYYDNAAGFIINEE